VSGVYFVAVSDWTLSGT